MKLIDYSFIDSYSPAANDLSKSYHKAQEKSWNGKEIIVSLLEQHGKPHFTTKKKDALIKVLSLVLWGEYTAWQVSNSLSVSLLEMDAKMAATAQAFDEARHFYVMCDYFQQVLDVEPSEKTLTPQAKSGLEMVLNTTSLPQQLLGMQLMVEPVAITIFKELQRLNLDPVLTELLNYYIRDEARHITLGVKQLPKELQPLSWFELSKIFLWQSRILKAEIDGLFSLRSTFEELGINYLELFETAEKKQIEAIQEMMSRLKWNVSVEKITKQITRGYLKFKTGFA